MSGFVLHPQAYADLDEIWEYIAADSLDAASKVWSFRSALEPFVEFHRHRRKEEPLLHSI